MKKAKDIDAYIALWPKDIQALLQMIRETVRKAAPEATEKISYGIPTFFLNENLVHFGAFIGHVSFFPTSSGISAFKKELKPKGTVQFPLDSKLPLQLIAKITKFRAAETKKKE
jgi:uncharacterized protein YdhG (YjbR/CyaY superfamily)